MIGSRFGNYRIEEQIGKGGMGVVYRAIDTKLGRSVAIKVLPEECAKDPSRSARLEREAQLLAALNHPRIAAIHGIEESGGTYALVLEYVPGDTLDKRMASGRLPVKEALKICVQIAEALESAHARGIIHRDLKPANVKITPDDRVKVLDFGLAKALEQELVLTGADSTTGLATQANVVMGTPGYMSPEQAEAKPLDRRADVWAFGCILYEMLAGRRAFAGNSTSEVLTAVLAREPDWKALPEDLPGRVRLLLRRCLEKDRDRRLRDIGDARLEMEDVLSGAAVEDEKAPATRRPWWPAAAGLLIGAALVGVWPLMWKAAPPVMYLELEVPTLPLTRHPAAPPIALSPDGRHVAYVLEIYDAEEQAKLKMGTNPGQLYLRRLDTQEATPIAQATLAYSPFFSPDSRWLAFVNGSNLMRIPVDGGPLERIAEVDRGVHGGDWTTDGVIYLGEGAAQTEHGLRRVPAAGGELQNLTRKSKSEGWYAWPSALPDGSGVLFTQINPMGSSNGIWIADSAGERQSQVMPDAAHARYLEPGYLAYVRNSALWAQPFDLKTRTLSGTPVRLMDHMLVGFPGEPTLAVWTLSETGTLLALRGAGSLAPAPTGQFEWTGQGRPPEIAVADLKAPNVQNLPVQGMRISPDGRFLSAGVSLGDGSWQLHIFDLQKGALRAAVRQQGGGYHSAWTPDSQRVAFNNVVDMTSSIYITSSEAEAAPELLVESPKDQLSLPYSWSRDGQTLFFSRHGALGNSEDISIWVKSVGGPARQILATEYSETHPAISPDGRKLAYSSNQTGRWQVYVRDYPSLQNRTQLTYDGGGEPAWSEDGRFVYLRRPGAVCRVSYSAGGTGKPEVVVETGAYNVPAGINVYGRQYEVRPDGKILLYRQPLITPHLLLAVNWSQSIQRMVAEGK